jgi:ATP-dependent Clp protease ATP-binding subunit ClpA
VILFHPLNREQIKAIVDLQVKEIAERLQEQGIGIELTEPARDHLADIGYDPQFGARPLRRTLQRKVESPLSRELLEGNFRAGDTVIVDLELPGLLIFRRKAAVPADPPTVLAPPIKPAEVG